MAGVGFELKKVFAGKSLSSKVLGYSCAAVIVSGPMFLVTGMLLVLQQISYRSSDENWVLLLTMITYAMIGSLLSSSLMTHVAARWSADAIYRDDMGRVLPSLYGSEVIIVLVCGTIYGLIISTAEVPLEVKIVNWLAWLSITTVYNELGFMTAIKKFMNVIVTFIAGIAVTVISALIFTTVMKIEVLVGIQFSIFLGFGVISCGYAFCLHREIPGGYGSYFRFAEYFDNYPELLFCGFFTMATCFVHVVVMWFGNYGNHITGLLYSSPVYEASTFYAYLVSVPTSILFVVSIETNFYSKFRSYFFTVSQNGLLKDISRARDVMIETLKNELLRLELVQVVFLMAYMALMRFYLSLIGFTQTILVMFFLLCIGYAAEGIGSSFALLLLYFDDRKGSVLVSFSSFVVTLAVSVLTLDNPSLYGLGMTCGGLTMLILGAVRLIYYVGNLDEHVFSSQPIFMVEKKDWFVRHILRLDEKQLKREENYVIFAKEDAEEGADR